MVGGSACGWFDLWIAHSGATSSASSRSGLLLPLANFGLVFSQTRTEKGHLDLPALRMALSYPIGRVDASRNARGNVDGHFSYVLLSHAMVSHCEDLGTCRNWAFLSSSSPFHFGAFVLLGHHRVDAMSIHAGFSMVPLVGHAMGTAGDSSDRPLCRSMGRFLLSFGFQYLSRVLSSSPFGQTASE